MAARRLAHLLTTAAVAAVVGGCHSAPATSSVATGSNSSHSSPATTTAAPTDPAVTEPLVPAARLRPILLTPADLPHGFAVGVPGTADDLLAIGACGQPLVDIAGAGATASVSQVLTRASDRTRLVEQVAAFASAAAASAPLVALRAGGVACHQPGVVAAPPLAVGEDVAGLRLPGPPGVVEVAMVRSGPIVTIFVLATPQAVADSTLAAVVQASGVKLAVATGG